VNASFVRLLDVTDSTKIWRKVRGSGQFDYIEMFYNPKRKHVRNGMLSPVEFERQQKT